MMRGNNRLLLYKEVDWSLFNDGIILPQELNHAFGQANDGKIFEEGKSRAVRLLFDGNVYCAEILSLSEEEREKENTKLKLTYPQNGDLSDKFKTIFKYTYNAYLTKRKRKEKDSISERYEETKKEYICIYSTKYSDVYYMEAVTANNVNGLLLAGDDIIPDKYPADIIWLLNLINDNKYCRENWKSIIVKFHKRWKEQQNNILLNNRWKYIWGRKVQLDPDERISDVLDVSIKDKEFIKEIEEEDLIQLMFSDNLDFYKFKKMVSGLFTKNRKREDKKTVTVEVFNLDVADSQFIQEKSDRIINNIKNELNAFKDLINDYNDTVAQLVKKINTQDSEISQLKKTIKDLNEKSLAKEELKSIKEELLEIKSLLENEKIS